MLSIAAIALAAASAGSSSPLVSTASWWERVTVTYDSEGEQRSCRYETSLSGGSPDICAAKAEEGSAVESTGGIASGRQMQITFERRFTPDAAPSLDALNPGDTLLGGHIMKVAIDRDGAVRGCSVVAASEEASPDYGCDEVKAERFQASTGKTERNGRFGYVTVLVYGHKEDIV